MKMDIETSVTEIKVEVEHLEQDNLEKNIALINTSQHDIPSRSDVLFSHNAKSNLTCMKCGKLYKSIATLQCHTLLKHPQNDVDILCSVCDKSYSSKLSLHKHMQYMHRYQHRCTNCYRSFPTFDLLKWHLECCVKIDTPCSICNKVFETEIALRNHIKYKHPENKTNWCDTCRRSFHSKRGLSNHMATIHAPGETKCHWCKRAFSSVPGLQSHILYKHRMDGARCTQCNKVFAKESSLARHLNRVHRYSDTEYVCSTCYDRFASSPELVAHIVSKHSNAEKATQT